MHQAAKMKSGTVAQAAKAAKVDPSTVRRWIQRECPVLRRGSRGPGRGALLDLAAVAAWRGRASGPTGLTVEDALQQISTALWECLEKDHADIRAGISREDAAAMLIVAFESCCKIFGKTYPFDQQPTGICALMHVL
jgi:hypothetical protein